MAFLPGSITPAPNLIGLAETAHRRSTRATTAQCRGSNARRDRRHRGEILDGAIERPATHVVPPWRPAGPRPLEGQESLGEPRSVLDARGERGLDRRLNPAES